MNLLYLFIRKKIKNKTFFRIIIYFERFLKICNCKFQNKNDTKYNLNYFTCWYIYIYIFI